MDILQRAKTQTKGTLMTTWHNRNSIGLKSPRSRAPFKAKPKGICYHWEGVQVNQRDAETSKQNLRSIQKSHLNNKNEGYSDIAYNFAFDHLGNIFELRGWDYQSGANGSSEANRTHIAFCYLGGPGNPLTDAAKRAIDTFQAEAKNRGVGQDHQPHSNFRATQCPGDEIRAYIGGAKTGTAQVPSPSPSVTVPAFPGISKRGSKGKKIVTMQQRLKDRGWAITVDGIFGPKTETIVRAFQKEKGLAVDGIVGPITWNALWTKPIT